ncbi:unnamed protein product, partial [Linum tenue]
ADDIHTEIGVVCRNIRRLLRETGNGTWQYVPREGNMAAHIMAHTETRWNEREVWLDRPPMILVDQLILDNVAVTSDQFYTDSIKKKKKEYRRSINPIFTYSFCYSFTSTFHMFVRTFH